MAAFLVPWIRIRNPRTLQVLYLPTKLPICKGTLNPKPPRPQTLRMPLRAQLRFSYQGWIDQVVSSPPSDTWLCCSTRVLSCLITAVGSGAQGLGIFLIMKARRIHGEIMIVAQASRGRMNIAYLCPQENMMASESAEEPYHRLLSMSPTLSAYVIKRQCRRLTGYNLGGLSQNPWYQRIG